MKNYPVLLFILLAACTAKVQNKTLVIEINPQETTTSASLRGLSVVDENIAWASGSGGTFLRTTDGQRWESDTVPSAGEYQFRDVEAFSATSALLLTAGNPAKVFKTTDGGNSWLETYSNTTEGIFFDAMDFWDNQHGIAFSDAVGGHLVIITTNDGGASWQEINYDNLPASPADGEGGFAASGTCITTFGDSLVWIGLGSPDSRVFKSTDRGATWTVVNTPMKGATAAAGIFSLEFISPDYGIAVGGDYELADETKNNAAVTHDGGITWTLIGSKGPKGYRSAVVHVPETDIWLAAGRAGVDYSADNGKTWNLLDTVGYYAIQFGSPGIGYASGSDGRIAKIIITQ